MFKVALSHEVAAGPLYKIYKNSIKCDKNALNVRSQPYDKTVKRNTWSAVTYLQND